MAHMLQVEFSFQTVVPDAQESPPLFVWCFWVFCQDTSVLSVFWLLAAAATKN